MIRVGDIVEVMRVDYGYGDEYSTPPEDIIGEKFKVIKIFKDNNFPYVLDSEEKFGVEFVFSESELKKTPDKLMKLKKKLMGGSDGN